MDGKVIKMFKVVRNLELKIFKIKVSYIPTGIIKIHEMLGQNFICI
jgi:hypothetical protein